MGYRFIPFVNQSFYHIYNRGVEKRQIFSNERDYQRFLQTLYYYQFAGTNLKPPFSKKDHLKYYNLDFSKNPKSIEIICYCLMPNHFHLLVRQAQDKGIQKFMQKTLNSYTKYFNTKNNRVGPLFQGAFKAVLVETDEQLLHVSRYIHLNPYVSDLTKDLGSYSYSSYPDYIGAVDQKICTKESVLDFFKSPADYQGFVVNHGDYARKLEKMKHLLLEKD